MRHAGLKAWVAKIASLTLPKDVHWCDGSEEEYRRLCDEMVASGTFIRLNPAKRPDSYLARSHPSDVARVEDRTYICCRDEGGCRPDQQLGAARGNARHAARTCSPAACAGRTMYVIPFSMGPIGIAHRPDRHRDHRLALRRRQHADHDAHGAARCSMRWAATASSFPACIRSARRWPPGQKDVPWPCEPDISQQVHRAFPRDPRNLVLRFGLRRQRPARQEVPGPAHRLGDGARRRLAGRAHADPRARVARRARRPTSPRPSPAPAARPTWP
ncbi:MAG: hypothetical protein MZW92_15010 [Comamonadaceae bacterium]|nr:hypothetical protein [Comamonadaceae bacterium]